MSQVAYRLRYAARLEKRWEDHIKEWTGIDLARSTRAGENRTRWKGNTSKSSVVPFRDCKIMGQNRIVKHVMASLILYISLAMYPIFRLVLF